MRRICWARRYACIVSRILQRPGVMDTCLGGSLMEGPEGNETESVTMTEWAPFCTPCDHHHSGSHLLAGGHSCNQFCNHHHSLERPPAISSCVCVGRRNSWPWCDYGNIETTRGTWLLRILWWMIAHLHSREKLDPLTPYSLEMKLVSSRRRTRQCVLSRWLLSEFFFQPDPQADPDRHMT